MDLESGVMSKVYIIPHSKIYKHFNKAATHVGVPPQMLENIKPVFFFFTLVYYFAFALSLYSESTFNITLTLKNCAVYCKVS